LLRYGVEEKNGERSEESACGVRKKSYGKEYREAIPHLQ